VAVDFQTVLSSPTLAYAEGLRFFRGEGMLNDALKRIVADLDRNGIDYAVIGAVALNQHGYRRFTEDIDLLLTKAGLERFRERLVGLGYRPAFEAATKKFRTTEDNIPVEIITTGEFPGDGLPKPVKFPEPLESSVVIKYHLAGKIDRAQIDIRNDGQRPFEGPCGRSGIDKAEKTGR
jgi:Uncharacterised nucleotidyltransferase